MSEVPHALINAWPDAQARAALLRCCGSQRWAEGMLCRRPFASDAALYESAMELWQSLQRADYLEAFAQHPAIGADPAALARKFAATANWSAQEQAGARAADAGTVSALHAGNLEYAERFGFTFIVCATGRSAQQMLAALNARLRNSPDAELAIAAAEQAKITRLRLAKLTP